MWLAESCFEGVQEPFRKGLLPGKSYAFGRKAPADLILADKTVSKESATLHVGIAHAATSGQERPTLRIHAHKRLVRVISEENEEEWKEDKDRYIGHVVNADSERQLQPGDTVALTKSAPSIKFLWQPIVIGAVSKVPKEDFEQRLEVCSSLGIHLEKSKQVPPGATHLLVPDAALLTVQLMQALASAIPLVTMPFVDEILRRAHLSGNEDQSWQKRYALPDPQRYFPSEIQVEHMSAEQIKEAMAAKESRKTLFLGTTLLFLHGEAGLRKPSEQLAPICKSSGARIVTADASGLTDDEAMMRLLRRNKSEAQTLLAECGETASEAPDEGLVVICDLSDSDMNWYRIAVSMTRKMTIAMPATGPIAINHAILHADARQFLNSLHDQPVGEEVADQSETITTLPPTIHTMEHQGESTQAEPIIVGDNAIATDSKSAMAASESFRRSPKPKPTSAPAPTPASTSASVADINSATPASSRKPKRRADMARRDPLEDIFGPSTVSSSVLDHNSESMDDHSQLLTARPRRYENRDATQRPRISEAFRSLFDIGGAEDANAAGDSMAAVNSSSRTKKYRDELDESDRLASQRQSHSIPDTFAKGQSEDGAASKKRRQSPPVEVPRRVRQRQSQVIQDDGGDQGELDSSMEDGLTRKETQNDGAEAASQGSTLVGETGLIKERAADSATDQGATDDKFLQAMATSKRSKKGLDHFDREFNLLRIAKPNHATGHRGKIIADNEDPEYRAWEQMGPSDFDINAAGNFVQVDFVPLVYQRSESEERNRAERQSALQDEWRGRPNFKKFKTKARPFRAPVVMDIEPEVDYGLGNGYIRPSRPRVQRADTPEDNVNIGAGTENNSHGRRKTTQGALSLSEEEEGTKRPSPKEPTQRARFQTRRSRGNTSDADSEEDGERRRVDVRLDVDGDVDDTVVQPRDKKPSTQHGSSLSASGGKRGIIDLSSDEDDDGGTFSGFRKRRKD